MFEHVQSRKSARVQSMQVWLRFLVVWFIAISLPAQAMMGAAMAHCGSAHDLMGNRAEATQQVHAGLVAAATRTVTDVEAQGDHGTAAKAEAPSGKSSYLAQHKCSSCASCCAGAALPSAFPHMPTPAAASSALVEAMVMVDAVASDGPDRPPRNLLV